MIDFDLAVAWHKTFMHHLDRELVGEDQAAILRHPGDDSCCALGRWLDGAGKACRQLGGFGAVIASHRAFHDHAGEMMRLHRGGKTKAAADLRATVVQQASNALLFAITAMRQEYAALSAEARAQLGRPPHGNFFPSLHWNEHFALGLHQIDNEHQQLTALANRLYQRPEATFRDEVVVDVLTSLGKFLVTHFHNEETVMRQIGMPEEVIAEHMNAHNRILDQYADLNIAAAGGNAYRATDILVHVMDWVGQHMIDHDLRIKDYLPVTG